MAPAATMDTTVTNSVASELNWRRDLIKDARNYELIGYVWKIVLEAAAGAATPERSVADSVGLCLDWYGMGSPKDNAGKINLPRIAQDAGHNVLLMLDPIKRTDGRVGLPDIPDPKWRPELPKDSDISWEPKRYTAGKNKGQIIPGQKPPDYKPQTAPMIEQSLYDRARGQMKETNYLVFGPIAQILVRPVKNEREGSTFLAHEGWILQCRGDANGKQMELLIDPSNGEALFYGGSFEIFRAG